MTLWLQNYGIVIHVFLAGMGGIAMFAINRYRCVGLRKTTLVCVGNPADAVVAGIGRISGQGVNLAKL